MMPFLGREMTSFKNREFQTHYKFKTVFSKSLFSLNLGGPKSAAGFKPGSLMREASMLILEKPNFCFVVFSGTL